MAIYLYSQGKNQEKVLEKNTNGIWALGDPLQWGWWGHRPYSSVHTYSPEQSSTQAILTVHTVRTAPAAADKFDQVVKSHSQTTPITCFTLDIQLAGILWSHQWIQLRGNTRLLGQLTWIQLGKYTSGNCNQGKRCCQEIQGSQPKMNWNELEMFHSFHTI